MTIKFYGLKTCDTCRKARKALDAKKVAYSYHDVRDDGVSKTQAAKWAKQIGWENLLNKSSTTWRNLPEKEKDGLSHTKAVSLMSAHPALIKRPVIEKGDDVYVGWKPDTQKAVLK
ncbi:MAG: Spx/MgsR family RNA polymerase-binding regulatory protein [Parvularculaceae bacterium]